MRTLLRLEEWAQFGACLVALIVQHVPWWMYLLLLLGPDISMLGYLVNTRAGAFTYNLLHHKAVALFMASLGVMMSIMSVHVPAVRHMDAVFYFTAIILFGHSSMDRMLGYGLKFGDNFHHTHLGWIGKGRHVEQEPT